MSLPVRVLIANRGEIAVRIARTCRSMGIGTVAVFSDVDAGAAHVAACDQAVRIGGDTPATSYLRVDALLDAARRTGADAVHPGYGFLSENAGFARAVVDAGLTWVGPSAEVIAAMGDKVAAKRTMATAGVPVLSGAEVPDGADGRDLAALADDVGFPLLVKAAAGGGGKGMRTVARSEDLAEAVAAARREAAGAFGDDRVLLERYVPRARHVEVQVLGDAHGGVVHAFERECSVQRRYQKVVEETPSPGLDDGVREVLLRAAVEAARTLGYVGAGTVEFVADEDRLAARRRGDDVDPAGCVAFLEVNTRLQVEHPVTEETVRIRAGHTTMPLDLVREQLLVASGAPLAFAQDDLVQAGHAVEARLYAEDPASGYLPRPGPLHVLAPAHGPGTRWDVGVRSGDVVGVHYDPLLAKVVAAAPTRDEAVARLARELDDTVVLGTTTNRDLLVAVLRGRAFLAGDTTTTHLDDHHPDGAVPPPDAEAVSVALLAATLERALLGHRDAVLPSVRPGFVTPATFVPEVTFTAAGTDHRVRWSVGRDGTWHLTIGDDEPPPTHDVLVHGHRPADGPAGVATLDLEVDGRRVTARIAVHDEVRTVATALGRVELTTRPRFPDVVADLDPGATLAPMPGAIATVAVTVGDRVEAGALLCTVEAMKMEHRVTAPVGGAVTDVLVAEGQQVAADEVLVVVTADAPG